MKFHLYCWNLEIRWQVNMHDWPTDDIAVLYLYLRYGLHLRSWRVARTAQFSDGSHSGLVYTKEVNAVATRWRVRGPIVREL